MRYIQRDNNNNIMGVYRRLQKGYAEELLPDSDAEVVAFLTRSFSSDKDRAESVIKSQKHLLGLIKVLADKFNIPAQQLITEIKNKI